MTSWGIRSGIALDKVIRRDRDPSRKKFRDDMICTWVVRMRSERRTARALVVPLSESTKWNGERLRVSGVICRDFLSRNPLSRKLNGRGRSQDFHSYGRGNGVGVGRTKFSGFGGGRGSVRCIVTWLDGALL